MTERSVFYVDEDRRFGLHARMMKKADTHKTAPAGATTLTDLARRAGVNKGTVSAVLSGGSGNTRVSDATRQRILQAAQDLHYQPNALARSLRSRRTHTVGFYMSGALDSLFLSEVVSGLYQSCGMNGRDFLMHGTFRDGSARDIYAELLNGKVDGLVLHVSSDDPLLSRLAASRLPVVVIANPAPTLPSVTVDDVAGSRLLAEHLAQKGHRRVLFVACPFPLSSTVRRHDAFLEAAEDWGMTVATAHASRPDVVAGELNRAFFALPTAQRPTAAVCWNDQTAYWVITRVREQGAVVPDDLAVAGFDGVTAAVPLAYRLTTIRAPWHEVARTAVDLLCLSPGKPPLDETILPVELIVGETT